MTPDLPGQEKLELGLTNIYAKTVNIYIFVFALGYLDKESFTTRWWIVDLISKGAYMLRSKIKLVIWKADH